MNSSKIPILMYHDVGGVDNPWCVSLTSFAEQMKYLHENGYQTISLDELKEGIDQGKELLDKSVIITFDDAREGVYTHAFPILKKYGFTAIVYVVPQWIDSKNIPQNEGYSNFLGWNQVKELLGDGWIIGSHTFSHQNLTKTDSSSLLFELEQAEKRIKEKLNIDVSHFSYPYGAYHQSILDEINQKYKTAVTIEKGFSKKSGEYARQWVTRTTTLISFQKQLQRPTISLCMIVKNEEQFLEQCLTSVINLVDEIIVVDTGSTDKTKEIASSFGPTLKLFDFKWCDDFAAARNESLKHVTGDWILILDADEIIDKNDFQRVLEAVNQWDVAGYRIMTRNYSNDSAVSGWQPALNHTLSKSFQGWFPSLKVRLFQRNKSHFVGRMHEVIDEGKLVEHGKITTLSVPVHHYGALKNDASKQINYFELAKKKIKDSPKDAKAYFELAMQYKKQNDFSSAEQYLDQSLQLDGRPITPLLNLAIVQQKQGKLDLAISNYQRILEKKENADAYFGLGFCYFKKNELRMAADFFSKAIAKRSNFVDAYINLGAVLERMGDFSKAMENYKRALQYNPLNARIYYNLGVLHEKEYRLEIAIDCYNRAVELNYLRKEELLIKIEKMKKFIMENKNFN
jgi:glycosyltransferase involved in cell wall biosynthesis